MFCEDLRHQTHDEHEAAAQAPFVRALLAGTLGIRALVDYLAALHPVYAALEEALAARHEDSTIALFDHRALDRAARLRADLDGFGCRGRVGSSAVRSYVAAIRASEPVSHRLLAHHYIRYLGDLAGGQAIARLVGRHYGVGPAALSYLDFSDLGDGVHYRKQYRARLDLIPWTPTEQAEFIAEAQLAYGLNAALFDELGERLGVGLPRRHAARAFLANERAHLRG